MKTIDTELGPIATRTHGTGECTVVLLHSLYVDSGSFDAVIPALAARHRVITLDAPCHGRSPGPRRDFSLEEYAECVRVVLSALGVARADLVGNALGGHAAVILAARAPELVRSLVVACSPMQPMPSPFLPGIVLERMVRFFGVRDFVFAKLKAALVRDDASEEIVAYLRRAMTCVPKATLARAIRCCMLRRPSLVELLPSVQAPALFVTTDVNTLWPEALAKEHARELPRGSFALMTGARHLPPLETPAAFAQIVEGFLART